MSWGTKESGGMRQQRFVIAAGLCLVAFSLLLRSAVPVFAITDQRFDDGLFLRLAYSLGAGKWLGPYDDLTLAKGMAYPAFILAAFATGIPLKLAEQGVYLAACGLMAWLVARLTRNRWLALLLFGCLALNPVLWTTSLAHVRREGIYISLSLAVIALAAILLLAGDQLRSANKRFAVLVMLGLVGAAYWLTREEGIWLVPALAVLIVASAVENWSRLRSRDHPTSRVRRLVLPVGAAAIVTVTFTAVVGTVGLMNYRYYGAFTTNEFQSAPFRAAYGALSRIQHGEWQRYIVFPQDARDKAYSVSAAAGELHPFFEGALGELWRKSACEQARIEPCRDIPAGWFIWAFRQAVAAAGHYSSARDAFAFYERLAAEINTACDDGRIACLASRATLMPPFRGQFIEETVLNAPRLGNILLDSGKGEIGAPPSDGPQSLLDRFADLVGPLSGATQPFVVLRGKSTTAAGLFDIFIRDRDVAPFRAAVRTMPLTETASPQSSRAIEFELTTDCLRPSCELVVRWAANERTFPIESLMAGLAVAATDMELTMSMPTASAIPSASVMRRDRLLDIARAVTKIYAGGMSALAAMAVLGIFAAIALQRFIMLPHGIVALALACFTAVATRIALLAYLDVTSFPAANLSYLSSASPFLLIFVVLGFYLIVQVAMAYRTKWRR
jgi:hypothetical protein